MASPAVALHGRPSSHGPGRGVSLLRLPDGLRSRANISIQPVVSPSRSCDRVPRIEVRQYRTRVREPAAEPGPLHWAPWDILLEPTPPSKTWRYHAFGLPSTTVSGWVRSILRSQMQAPLYHARCARLGLVDSPRNESSWHAAGKINGTAQQSPRVTRDMKSPIIIFIYVMKVGQFSL